MCFIVLSLTFPLNLNLLLPTQGSMKGAGTTSNVFVEMQGTMGKFGPIQLDSPTAFDRGKVRICV